MKLGLHVGRHLRETLLTPTCLTTVSEQLSANTCSGRHVYGHEVTGINSFSVKIHLNCPDKGEFKDALDRINNIMAKIKREMD